MSVRVVTGEKAVPFAKPLQHRSPHHAKWQGALKCKIHVWRTVYRPLQLRYSLAQRRIREPQQPADLGPRRPVEREKRCNPQRPRQRGEVWAGPLTASPIPSFIRPPRLPRPLA